MSKKIKTKENKDGANKIKIRISKTLIKNIRTRRAKSAKIHTK